jgi:hypothetical protein
MTPAYRLPTADKQTMNNTSRASGDFSENDTRKNHPFLYLFISFLFIEKNVFKYRVFGINRWEKFQHEIHAGNPIAARYPRWSDSLSSFPGSAR